MRKTVEAVLMILLAATVVIAKTQFVGVGFVKTTGDPVGDEARAILRAELSAVQSAVYAEDPETCDREAAAVRLETEYHEDPFRYITDSSITAKQTKHGRLKITVVVTVNDRAVRRLCKHVTGG